MSRIESGDSVYVEGGIFGIVIDTTNEMCGDCSVGMVKLEIIDFANHYDGDEECGDVVDVLLSKCDLL